MLHAGILVDMSNTIQNKNKNNNNKQTNKQTNIVASIRNLQSGATTMAGVTSTDSPECVFTNAPLSHIANGEDMGLDPEVPTGKAEPAMT